jgi:hypothetical protein
MGTSLEELRYEAIVEEQRFAEKLERGECLRCSEAADEELYEEGIQMCSYCHNLFTKDD